MAVDYDEIKLRELIDFLKKTQTPDNYEENERGILFIQKILEIRNEKK